MKTTFFFLFTIFILPTAFAQNTNAESLATVVLTESDAFYDRDADTWQKTWLHSSKITRTLISNDKYTKVSGWNKYAPDILKFLKNNPKGGPVIITNDSFVIKNMKDTAWIEYRQIMATPGPDSSTTQISKEYRVLVKKKNEWKILSMITHAPPVFISTSPADLENSLNTTGFKLMSTKKLKDAVEVFKLNVKLNPTSWLPYNSLGEAYTLSGNKNKAIENYKKSLKLNPKNTAAIKALKKLKTK